MMNGAAMNCRQDQVLRSLQRDACGLQGAGYHLQMNNPSEQNYAGQHSKATPSQSDHFVIADSSQYFQSISTVDSCMTSEVRDPRTQVRWAQTRTPIDLPVPHFQIDVNFVGNHLMGSDESYLDQKNLDLDTRIDLLIRSKALAGMHPIFSELDESTDESDDSIIKGHTGKFKGVAGRKHRSPPPVNEFTNHESDDPDKPLSRPPSPFLSRAKYLFWFNKAIELKEQAKAQEQALIEKATKKLIHDNVNSLNSSSLNGVNQNDIQTSNKENKPCLNDLFDEISKEMKDLIKQQFIDDVLESAISNTLDSWWEKEQVKDEQQNSLINKSNSSFQEESMEISQNSLKLEEHENVIPELEKTAYLKESHLFENGFDSCNKIKSSESLEKYTHTNRNSSIHSCTTSMEIKEDSLLEPENKQNKICESKTETNMKSNRPTPIIDIQELLSNIESTLDKLSKGGVLSKISESNEELKTNDSSNPVTRCQQEQWPPESSKELSTECNSLSDVNANKCSNTSENGSNVTCAANSEDENLTVIENESTNNSENVSTCLSVSNGDNTTLSNENKSCNIIENNLISHTSVPNVDNTHLTIIENKSCSENNNLSNFIPVASDDNINLTTDSHCESQLITGNEQILLNDTSQKHNSQQGEIEASVILKNSDELLHTPVMTLPGNEVVDANSEILNKV